MPRLMIMIAVVSVATGCIGGATECDVCEIVISSTAPTEGDLVLDLDRGIGSFDLEVTSTNGAQTLTDPSWVVNDDTRHEFEVTGLPDPAMGVVVRFGSQGALDVDVVDVP